MKIIIHSIIAVLFLFSMPPNEKPQTNEEAFKYFKEFSKSSKGIKSSTWVYLRALAKSKNPKRIEKQRLKLLASIKKANDEIQAKELVDGDASLRDGMMQYLEMEYKIINEDYADIVDMEEIAERSYDDMEAYLMAQEEANKKLEEAFADYKVIEKEFCKKNNIQLLEADDPLSKKIEKAASALSYYNELFLIFFKSNMEETYIMDALDRSDINALQQSTNALLSFSEEGLETLKSMEPYMGDPKLKSMASKFLKHFKEASTKSYPKMVNFYLVKEDFEKANKNFEKIKPKKRTQKDIDTYNNAVNKFNKVLNEFNSANGQLNEKRSKLFSEWEKTTAKFFEKHVD